MQFTCFVKKVEQIKSVSYCGNSDLSPVKWKLLFYQQYTYKIYHTLYCDKKFAAVLVDNSDILLIIVTLYRSWIVLRFYIQKFLITLAFFIAESLSLREVAEHLNKETLKKLKSEYGGLQTLLKNNHQVFEGKGVLSFVFLNHLFYLFCVQLTEKLS